MTSSSSSATRANPSGMRRGDATSARLGSCGPVRRSNVALYDEKLGKATRTRWQIDGDTKVRVGVKSGTKFEAAGL